MTPANAITYLLDLPRFAGVQDDAYKPGLERVEALLAAMGQPHRAFPSVHVAGTNGKGSVASMIAAVGTAAGRRVGLHTSPHLHRLTERMRLDGTPAPDDWLADAVARYRDAFDRLQPSFFEATVALSFRYFADQHVDGAVVEVGLGGRLDATNVLRPTLAVITNVDLDHTTILGDTVAAIAREKGGIIKPGVPVLTGVKQAEAWAVLEDLAAERNAPLHRVDEEVDAILQAADVDGAVMDVQTPHRRYQGLRVGLSGAYQQHNARLAVRAAELVGWAEDPQAVYRGLADVRALSGLRGRFEVLQERPLIVADAAHNPMGLRAALDTLRALWSGGESRLVVAYGGVRDKDVPAMARLLAATGAEVWPVQFDTPRALPAQDTARILSEAGASLGEAGAVADLRARFTATAEPIDALLITGSHGVVIPALDQSS